MTEDYEHLLDERNDYKSRLEQKERDHAKFDSKIKALEKIINSNNSHQRTPISQFHQVSSGFSASSSSTTSVVGGGGGGGAPSSTRHNNLNTPINQHQLTSSGASSLISNNATNGSSSNTNNKNLAGLSSASSGGGGGGSNETPMASRINRIVAGNLGVGRSGASTTNQQQNSVTPATGSRIGSIINSAAYNRYQTPVKSAHHQQISTGNSREGIPVANKRHQRRSKSVEMWLDHKPPMTAKTGWLADFF